MKHESRARLALRAQRLIALGPIPPWWRPFARHRWRRRHAKVMAMSVSVMAEILCTLYEKRIEQMAARPAWSFASLKKDRP